MEYEESPVSQMTDESNALILRVRQAFESMGRDASGLPDDACAQSTPISIVFAGQYSAGKSSLVKALTGNEGIEIGHKVTTQTATPYPWRDKLIIDTPGIGTGLDAYKEHDAISLNAILTSDVLVYVVTSEGFDNLIAKEFRRLIIDRDKASETILVVNKMMECGNGNTPEQRAIIARDIANTTKPYSPEELHAVYVDAQAYLDSVECEDDNPRMSSILRRDSNMDDLVLALEEVSQRNGATARLTTPLYQTIGEIDKAIDDLDSVEFEKTQLLKSKLRTEHAAIVNMKSDIISRAQSEYTDASSRIKDEGREIADAINECESESDAEIAITASSKKVLEIETECVNRIDALLQEAAEQLEVAIEKLCASLQHGLDVEVAYEGHEQLSYTRMILGHLVRDGTLEKGGNKLIALSLGDAAESGLKMYRASEAHLFFRELSKRLGIRLKPWGAVKLAKGLNYLGKALGTVSVILPALLELKDERDAEARSAIARSNRDNVRSQYNDAANSFVDMCSKGVENFNQKFVQTKIDAIIGDLATIEKDEMRRSVQHANLATLRDDCSKLIDRIHNHQEAKQPMDARA